MEEPPAYGTFHLIAIGLTVLLTLVLCVFARDAKDKTYRRILFVIWLVMFLMEGIKQLSQSYSFAADGSLVWSYYWGSFPFQLCDGPLYLLLPIALLPDGKVRTALSAYMSTYIVLGGVATYIWINTTLCNSVYVNVQTSVHHGLQIVSGIFIAVHNRKDWSLKTFLGAFLVFLVAVGIATGLNVWIHTIVSYTVNMFFISPYFRLEVQFLNDAWQSLHWTQALGLYVVGVSALAFVIYLIYMLLFRITRPAKARE